MRHELRFALVFALVASQAPLAWAQSTLRCESPDGKVTYAQNYCPPGTQPVRAVGAAGQPTPDDRKAAQTRARDDAKALERLEREKKAEAAQRDKAQGAVRVRAEAHARTCKRLELRVKQARDDVNAAPLGKRPEAERRLKKQQERYELDCGPQK